METKVKYYQELFGLQNWKIIVKYDVTLNANAKTVADPRYFKAEMTFRVQADPPNEDEIVVHEMIHLLMSLLEFFCDNMSKPDSQELFFIAQENATSQITHVIMRLLNERKKGTT